MKSERVLFFIWLGALIAVLSAVYAFSLFLNGKNPQPVPLTIPKYSGDCEFPFLELTIKETKTGSRINFSVEKYEYECFQTKEQLEGNCAWLYRLDPQVSVEYTIRTYDKNGRQVAVYEAHSARFLFWDKWDEEGKIVDGGSEELAESQNDVRLPYNSRVASIKIKIEDNSLTREHWGLENAGEEKELVRVRE